ncbi:MAG: hypothetical protein WA796_20190 [Pseudolabrys sp.]|jgi:hypothetical protein
MISIVITLPMRWPARMHPLRNADVIDLYERVKVGTKVVVM